MKWGLVVFLVLVLLTAGCVGNVSSENAQNKEKVSLEDECINACESALDNDIDLSSGPCLLDPMSNPDWVCDVAHSPRENIDNLMENQCDSWPEKSHHFIEVDPNCKLIRVY